MTRGHGQHFFVAMVTLESMVTLATVGVEIDDLLAAGHFRRRVAPEADDVVVDVVTLTLMVTLVTLTLTEVGGGSWKGGRVQSMDGHG